MKILQFLQSSGFIEFSWRKIFRRFHFGNERVEKRKKKRYKARWMKLKNHGPLSTVVRRAISRNEFPDEVGETP